MKTNNKMYNHRNLDMKIPKENIFVQLVINLTSRKRWIVSNYTSLRNRPTAWLYNALQKILDFAKKDPT